MRQMLSVVHATRPQHYREKVVEFLSSISKQYRIDSLSSVQFEYLERRERFRKQSDKNTAEAKRLTNEVTPQVVC